MTVYVREVSKALAATGVRTDILTRATGDEPQVVELYPGVRVISLEAGPPGPVPKEELTAYIGDFVAASRAHATGRRISYDLVHSHYWQSGLAGKRLALAWGSPWVHSPHTLARVKNRFLAPGDLPEPAERLRGEEEVIVAGDVLVASTDDEWHQMACLYGAPHDRLKTVHPGVDHHLFRPLDRDRARRALGLQSENVLLYVGRIQPLKGIDLALRAVDQLRNVLDRPLRFFVVGGASGRNGAAEVGRLKGLAADLGVSDVVSFEGPQMQERLPLYYNAADAMVMCSFSESFGLSALEAHSCGTPVVATSVGGLKHIVRDGETGFLVDQRDPSVFAAQLKTLLSDRQVAASFRIAAQHAAASFSWSKTARSLAELYECLIEERMPEVCTC